MRYNIIASQIFLLVIILSKDYLYKFSILVGYILMTKRDVHEDLSHFYLNQHIKKEQLRSQNKQRIKKSASLVGGGDSAYEDDLLFTNSIHSNPIGAKVPTRYFQFTSTHINMNSNSRIVSEFIKTTQISEVISLVPKTEIIPTPQVPISTNIDASDRYVVKASTSSGYDVPKVASTYCNIIIDDAGAEDNIDDQSLQPPKQGSDYCATVANQILDNLRRNESTVDQDTSFLGQQSVLEQIYRQSNLPTPNPMILTSDSQYLVKTRFVPKVYTTVNRNEHAISIGGLRAPETVEHQSICVTDDNLNRYVFQLDRKYTNIKMVKIVSSNFQQFDYIINNQNNEITFQIKDGDDIIKTLNGDDTWTYRLPIGNLNVTDIASIMEEDINSTIKSETNGKYSDVFHVKVDTRRNIFDITTIEPFTFTWQFVNTNNNFRSLHQMLGFSEPKQSNFGDSFRNNEQFNLRLSDYMLIESKHSALNQVYDSYTQKYYFNIIHLPNTPTIKNEHVDIETVIENSNLSIDHFDIQFFDQWGNALFFGNKEFAITILVVEYTDKLTDVGINTKRGIADTSSISRVQISQLGQSSSVR